MLPHAMRMTMCRCALGGALVALLAGCGQAPPIASAPGSTSTVPTPDLQATVDALQTQVAVQPSPTEILPSPAPATVAPPPTALATAAPAATEPPTAEANPLVGVWVYSQTLLNGELQPRGTEAPEERLEFFADKTVEISYFSDIAAMANLPANIKGTYALSADNTVSITVNQSSNRFTLDGDRLVATINVFSKIGPDAKPDKEVMIYTRVK